MKEEVFSALGLLRRLAMRLSRPLLAAWPSLRITHAFSYSLRQERVQSESLDQPARRAPRTTCWSVAPAAACAKHP